MKKIMKIILLSLTILAVSASAAMAAIAVVIEGSGDEYPHYLSMSPVPVIEDGTTLVPLRIIAEDLGYQVEWDNATSGILVKGNGKEIRMTIGNQIALVNSMPVRMELPPRLTSDRTLVSLGFLCDTFGYFEESSTAWKENFTQIFITPYTLIKDSEIAGMNQDNFEKIPNDSPNKGGFVQMRLKKNGITPGGVQLTSSIHDVLQIYGVPRGPYRNLNYPPDWSGKLIYWGTFVPQSDLGTFWEFSFDQGALTDLSVIY